MPKHKPNYKQVTLPDGRMAIVDGALDDSIIETFSKNIRPDFAQTRYTELWKEALGIK